MPSDENKNMITRFVLVYALIVIGFICVLGKVLIVQQIEGKKWIEVGNYQHSSYKPEIPMRGNIYSDSDTTLLAASVPVYDLRIDMLIIKKQDFNNNVDSLAACLARRFGNKSKEEYKRGLIRAYRQKNRNYALVGKKVSYVDFCEVRQFPLLRREKGKISPLKENRKMERCLIYGNLGRAVIGKLDTDTTGLEAVCDSFLSGKSGMLCLQRHAGRDLWVPEVAAQNGADVVSTLNVDMQDIADKALRRKLTELNAELGCAVVMEVGTGQIKACVNLQRGAEGVYYEDLNHVLRGAYQPGSTFKIPALMAMIEDEKVHDVDSLVDCEKGEWFYYGERIPDTKRGGFGEIPIEQVIVRSSNIGMSKLVVQYYQNSPQDFVEALRKIGAGKAFDTGFGAAAVKPSILGRGERKGWSPVDLPFMSFGYGVTMPLLYTLTFYNAIANDGKMLAPYFIQKIKQNGKTVKEYQPTVLQEQICSPSTLATIKDLLVKVVTDSINGTGRRVKSEYVSIAGKSGTAQADGKTRHHVSFCGFFPVEKPKYSCIVFIQIPSSEAASGGSMAGEVLKEIAGRVTALTRKKTVNDYAQASAPTENQPQPLVGNTAEMKRVFKALKIKTEDERNMPEWSMVKFNNTSQAQFNTLEIKENTVPDFTGMNLKDAIVLAQKYGLKVKFQGAGKIAAQRQNGTGIEFILK